MALRRKLRRFIITTLSIIAITCLAFWGYITYQQRSSYQTQIPANTNALLRIDVYQIYKSLLPEYFNKKKSGTKNKPEGIVIPANIFCYTVEGKQQSTIFSCLQVSSFKKLNQYFKSQHKLVATGTLPSGIYIYTTADKKWTIAYNQNRIAIAYSASREIVTDIINDIVLQRNSVAVKDSKFKAIEELEGHITYLSGKDKGSLTFDKGVMTGSFTLSSLETDVPAQISHQKTAADNAVNLWCFIDAKPFLAGKTFQLDSIKLIGDSILKYQPKGIELIVSKSVLQRDSVVTYDYNDDFEKVATTTVKESKIPGISFSMQTATSGLYQYLQRATLIRKDSGIVNRNVFPLYQLHASVKEGQLKFSTFKSIDADKSLVSSPYFFQLSCNFQQLKLMEEFIFFHRYIKPYKLLEARAIKEKNQQIKLDLSLHFNDSNRQSLAQLFEVF